MQTLLLCSTPLYPHLISQFMHIHSPTRFFFFTDFLYNTNMNLLISFLLFYLFIFSYWAEDGRQRKISWRPDYPAVLMPHCMFQTALSNITHQQNVENLDYKFVISPDLVSYWENSVCEWNFTLLESKYEF